MKAGDLVAFKFGRYSRFVFLDRKYGIILRESGSLVDCYKILLSSGVLVNVWSDEIEVVSACKDQQN